ncbi:hypothetical protein DO73_4924 [Burkholderia pseudomallei]|nr:hypothetical protein DO73_4924 [Burkholderia pseudomallei]
MKKRCVGCVNRLRPPYYDDRLSVGRRRGVLRRAAARGPSSRAAITRLRTFAAPKPRTAGLSSRPSHRHFGRQLHLLQRNLGLHALHAANARQVLHLELPIVVDVGRHHAQQEIAVARHQMALDHLRQVLDRFGEVSDGVRVLFFQPDPREHGQPAADLRGIEHRDVPLDHAGFLEQPHAPQARRRRQADFLREFDVLLPAVALQCPQDAPIDRVELH